jgi:hypothetical protein
MRQSWSEFEYFPSNLFGNNQGLYYYMAVIFDYGGKKWAQATEKSFFKTCELLKWNRFKKKTEIEVQNWECPRWAKNWKKMEINGRGNCKQWIEFTFLYKLWPITVAARSEAWNVFALSDAGIVSSNPTQGMAVCVYSVFVLGSGLAKGWSLVQGVLRTVLD